MPTDATSVPGGLTSWSVHAVNLPDHASNAIHTDAGARAAGFDAALVAGVTVYAYLAHVPLAGWGIDWLRSGGGEVQFRHPVLDGRLVEFVPDGPGAPGGPGDDVAVTVRTGATTNATGTLALAGTHPARCTGDGDALEPMSFEDPGEWNDYVRRAGDDLTVCDDHGVVHPVAWMSIGNQFFHQQMVTGPGIHVRSRFRHLDTARVDERVDATASVVDRFDSRAGRRAILDVRISAGGRPVAVYEHEAIIELATA